MITITETDLVDLLSVRYSAPAWAFLPQVRNGTGWARNQIRTADALAMSLYPSRGLHLHGFEIKVNRGDWLHELKNPQKAEDFIQWCDFWWVVAPKGLVQPGEVPATWGLIEPKGRGLTVKKEAPQLATKPMDRLMLAGIMRRLGEVSTPEGKIKEAEGRGYRKGLNDRDNYTKNLEEDVQKLKKIIADFGRVSGVHLSEWAGETQNRNVAKAVRIVLAGEDMKIAERLQDFRKTIQDLLELCDKAIEKDAAKAPAVPKKEEP